MVTSEVILILILVFIVYLVLQKLYNEQKIKNGRIALTGKVSKITTSYLAKIKYLKKIKLFFRMKKIQIEFIQFTVETTINLFFFRIPRNSIVLANK